MDDDLDATRLSHDLTKGRGGGRFSLDIDHVEDGPLQ